MPSPGEARWAARTVATAAVLGGLGVALGAFGAHGLEGRVTPDRLETFGTGVQYHLLHALALLVLPSVAARLHAGALRWTARLWTLGVAVFSGSLYLLVLLDLPFMGAITPIGGIAFIAGWIAVVLAAVRASREPGA